MSLSRLSCSRRLAPAMVSIAVLGCGVTDPVFRNVPPDIVAFVRDQVPKPREITAVVSDTASDVFVFTATYGEPQDCPSGCFYLGGVGLRHRSQIGWIILDHAPSTATFYDVRRDDSILFSETLWDALPSERIRFHFSMILACDSDTPPDVLIKLAMRLSRERLPFLARLLLDAAQQRGVKEVAEIIAQLEPGVPSFDYERELARLALENWPGVRGGDRCARAA